MTPPKTLTVKVTQKHIRNGVRCSNGTCPVALALREHFKNESIDVCPRFSYVDNYTIQLEHSWPARTFIERFDNRLPVSPATFRFRRIEP